MTGRANAACFIVSDGGAVACGMLNRLPLLHPQPTPRAAS